jgi:hypothetical protein
MSLFGSEMLQQHVIQPPGWPGSFVTPVADEYPSSQGFRQSRSLPKPIGFHPLLTQTRDGRNPHQFDNSLPNH